LRTGRMRKLGAKRGGSRLQPIRGLTILCFFFLGVTVLAPFFLFPPYLSIQTACAAETQPEYGLLREAWEKIERHYVDRSAVDPKALTYGALSGMVEALGDEGHSAFLSPEMLKIQRHSSEGKIEGIGAEVRMKGNQLTVVAPLDDSPAQRAGLRPGDLILKVNGENITGLPLPQAVEKILGRAGTRVTLIVLTPSTGNARSVTLVRASVTLRNVTWHGLPGTGIALLRIAAFSEGVTQALRKVLATIREEQFHGLILDLRNNPGGLLDEAVEVASQFLREGNVLLEKNSSGATTPVPVKPGGLLPRLPLVVLVNVGSASAAEVVAGALHDAHRALLVGETTFGTGTVLREFPLSDGSALLLAVEEWLTPSGFAIWHKGIDPDVEVSLPLTASPLLPTMVKEMTEEGLKKSDDTQLLRALAIVMREVRPREATH
jgi:carboxyl-terminal processing protease